MATNLSVPMLDLKAAYQDQQDMLNAAAKRVLESGWYLLGKETEVLERAFAEFLGVPCAMGVGSGTDALIVALKACGIGLGDEVITVSHTAVATVAAIEMTGATPVFVDIDPDTFLMDTEQIERVISPNTRALVPVHLYGQSVDMTYICDFAKEKGLYVIEDCAQAAGATFAGKRVGSFGDFGAFSFYPTKNLGALGDGGMIVSSDKALFERAASIRQYGWKKRFISEEAGLNSRLDEFQAAFLNVKLPTLPDLNARRVKWANLYLAGLRDTPLILPQVLDGRGHCWHLFVVRCRERAALIEFLKDRNIHTQIHYPIPVHQQPAYSDRINLKVPLPHTEAASAEILSLPLYPEMREEQVNFVVRSILEFYGK